jgi:pimeloyl-ACP methyl ester carboxylesterase
MPIADVNGIQIAYDIRGPAGAPAILLIMGLGTQMIAWSDPFCDGLAVIELCVSITAMSACPPKSRVPAR